MYVIIKNCIFSVFLFFLPRCSVRHYVMSRFCFAHKSPSLAFLKLNRSGTGLTWPSLSSTSRVSGENGADLALIELHKQCEW